MSNRDNPEILAISEQAADWLRVLHSAGPRQRAAFWRWMAKSPTHMRELLVAKMLDDELGVIDRSCRIDVKALVAQASSDITPVAPQSLAITHAQVRSPLSWLTGIAACIALLAVAAFFFCLALHHEGSYTTQSGEELTLRLRDGSLVTLANKSRVDVRFRPDVCDVYVRRGSAAFRTQDDPQCPLRVHVAQTTLQAQDTEFEVRLVSEGAEVSVFKGDVRILGESGSDAADTLTASAKISSGEEAVVEAGERIGRPRTAAIGPITTAFVP